MTSAQDPAVAGPPVIAAVFATGSVNRFIPTLRSIVAHIGAPIVVGAPDPAILAPLADVFPDVELVACGSLGELVDLVAARRTAHVLVVGAPVLFPEAALDRALAMVADDARVGTVSFFSNRAELLSFPERNREIDLPVGARDESLITAKLRDLAPAGRPALLPVAMGGAVLVSLDALLAVGGLARDDVPFAALLAEFSLRGRRRGLFDLLDSETFISRPSDLNGPAGAPVLTGADLAWIRERHPVGFGLLFEDARRADSPVGLEFTLARAKAAGLRVLIDGSRLWPSEMGTQVATLRTIEALANHPDVAEVGVAMVDVAPDYATAVLAMPKVRSRWMQDHNPEGIDGYDVGHRPFQPDEAFDLPGWQRAASRVVVSILDLIGFQIGAYFASEPEWLQSRALLERVVAGADGVTVISEDVAQMCRLARLPIEPQRLFPIPLGTEHLGGDAPVEPPAGLLADGRMANDFLLCLGTNYTHKNRDLAIATVDELRARGRDITLVLAGTSVRFGTTRIEEARLISNAVISLPGVTSAERNWLLKHAACVLYPTSAEGFGLVPHEAAQFSTPTVNVAFGPLREIGGEPPVSAKRWDAAEFADAVESLLVDPGLARAQVEHARKAGARFSWERAASEFVLMYRTLLAAPPNAARLVGRAEPGAF
jgi:glycosyltransferase involved in cell wall biosynthesis